nr:retrovirus-related Pol polyprotein from transposon TNT 1-94 [Tanacetum cinerariifolium]
MFAAKKVGLYNLQIQVLDVGNKMHKAFPLLVTEFPLPEELPTAREDSCHCQKKREATARKITLLSMSRRNCQSKVAVTLIFNKWYQSLVKNFDLQENHFQFTSLSFFSYTSRNGSTISHRCQNTNPGYRKIRAMAVLDTTISSHEHYALWEVIEFGDSYEVPTNTTDTTTTDTTSGKTGTKSGRTVTLTAEDMHKKKNDVKARTTLLLSLPDEHQLRFSKYKTTRELWAAILKTFCGNEATKKTKKNLLKQQYGNFRAEGSETLEQTFSRLQVIVEWLMHTTIWRNKSDLDTMSLDDLYNHLKVYESEVQKKTEPNSQNMAFISSAKHSSRNENGNTACVPTASINVPTASASNMALLSIRADKFRKRTGKKISIQGSDVAGFDKSKVECFNCHKMGHFTKECRDPRSQDRGRRDNFRHGSKAEEQAPKALMAIDGVGWDWSYMANDGEDHALVADEEAPTEFALMANKQVTDYSRPEPTIESSPDDAKKRNPSVSETVSSPITPKPFFKFVKESNSQSKSKTDETETPKKSLVKENQRNWNNLKSHQLGLDFVMKKKACFNCGDFNHLAYDCRKMVKRGTTRSQNNTYKCPTHRPGVHKPHGPPMRPMRSNMNVARPNITSFNKPAHSYTNRPFQRKSAVRSQYKASWVPTVNRNFLPVNRKFSTGSRNFPTANRKFPTASRKFPTGSTKFSTADIGIKGKAVKPSACWVWKPSQDLSNKGPNNNSVSVMFKKYTYIDTQGRLKDFKLLDDANVLLKTPMHHNMYSIDLNNIVPHKDLTCLVAKASVDECMKWHRRLENLKDLRVKIIRCDNGREFRNKEMNGFCSQKGIKREFSNARTPQQNGVAKRRNRTLIEVARTMLADAKLPVTFWAEAVNTACYVQNRVLVNKSYNKTPYELFNGRTPAIGFLKPFGCHVMILNTLNNLGKSIGYFIGYSMSSKAFRVFNK